MMDERWMDREDRLNLRSTIIASFVANCAPSGKKNRKAISPQDIIHPWRDRSEEQLNSPEDQVAALRMLFGTNAIETEVIPVDE